MINCSGSVRCSAFVFAYVRMNGRGDEC